MTLKHRINMSENSLSKIIDTSEQLDLPFVDTKLNHSDDDPRENYSNLISVVENGSIFTCKPLNQYPENDYRNFSDQTIIFNGNKSNIKKVTISASRHNKKNSETGDIETVYSYLDFHDELILSIIIKLISLEKVSYIPKKNKGFSLDNPDFISRFALITTFSRIKEETKSIGKMMSYTTIKNSLEKLQSTKIEIEKENVIKVISLIESYEVYTANRAADRKLIIKISDLIADAVEDSHPYHLYNHTATYQKKNQIAVWIKKQIIFNHRNLRLNQPLVWDLDYIYRESYLFDLTKTGYANKQKLVRSMQYIVESKVTNKQLERLYQRLNTTPNEWEKEKFTEIEESHSINQALLKLNDLINHRRQDTKLVDEIQALYNQLNDEQQSKIFQLIRFGKRQGKQIVEMYPNESLISELKKINLASAKKKLTSKDY